LRGRERIRRSSVANSKDRDDELTAYIDNAIRWAKSQLGSKAWPFRCLAFVEDAYEISNKVEIFGGDSAKESADEYGVMTTQGFPPRGAFVFYDCFGPLNGRYKNWGHVGLSLGDGNVIHSWDRVRIDHYLDIQNLTPGAEKWIKPKYAGWTPVERVFRGYRKIDGDHEA